MKVKAPKPPWSLIAELLCCQHPRPGSHTCCLLSTSPIGLICLQRSQAWCWPSPDHQWQPVGPSGCGLLSGWWHLGQGFVVSARDPAGLSLSAL